MPRWAVLVVLTLGILAAALGAFHGVGEVLQGGALPPGIVFNAFAGPECPPAGDANCFPAMSLLPTPFLVIGIATLVLAAFTAISTVGTIRWVGRGFLLLLASSGLLLVGGGFLPPALGAVGAVVAYAGARQAKA